MAFHLRSNARSRLPRFLAGALLACVAAGCSSGALREEDRLARRPLPYSVAVFFDPLASSLPEPDPASPPAVPSFRKSGADVAKEMARALGSKYEVVSAASAIEAGGRTEALEAALNAYDYLVFVGLRPPPSYTEVSRPIGRAAVEVFFWIFGGLPSWFVPGVTYQTDTELTVFLLDLNEIPAGAGPDALPEPESYTVEAERAALSLWERSDIREDPEDYALSIVVPPMFIVPGADEEHSRESDSLTESVMNELEREMAELVQEKLIDRELRRPLRVMFELPEPGAEISGPWPRLYLDLISWDGIPLRRFDVHRLAEGKTPFRWVASDQVLAQWNEKLAAAAPGAARASVQVPVEIPLVSGRNIVKVRALRADGERLTRTVVYWYE